METIYFQKQGPHKYPPFLTSSPDEETGWIAERVTEANIEELQLFNDEICLDEHVYRNAKTKRLLNPEDAFILNVINKSWRDPASSGSFSGIHWFGADELREDNWMQSDCAYSESGYSPGENEAAFKMLKDYLEQSPWQEEEHYNYYRISGNGGVEGLYLRGWDGEKQEPTDFIRWWMKSDLVEYLRFRTGMARYDDLDGWDEDLFADPKQTFTADFDPEDEAHYTAHCEERWRECLQWAFDQSWWSVDVDDLDEDKKNEIIWNLSAEDLLVDAGNNEYFVQYQYSREQALNWLSPLVAAVHGYLKPLGDIEEDDFLPELAYGSLRRQRVLKAWRIFYAVCEKIDDPFPFNEVERILNRQVPRITYAATHGVNAKVLFTSEWPAHKIVSMTEELTKLLTS